MPTIALVDENPQALGEMSRTLEAEGFHIRPHQDTASALANLETDSPDLLILDISLPDLDGEELVRRLRQKSDIPVIVMTARATSLDKATNMEIPAADFIRKPFSHAVLVDRVRTLLRRQGFAEDAVDKYVVAKTDNNEASAPPATRYLNSSEQRAFGAALRRSVEVISGGTSRAKRS